MSEDMHVFAYDFHDHPGGWEPDDAYDFEFWMTVNVGDGHAGCYYQVHVCTPMSMAAIENKRGCFLIDQWTGIAGLLKQLNDFIDRELSSSVVCDPYESLAKHWLWEYEGMS